MDGKGGSSKRRSKNEKVSSNSHNAPSNDMKRKKKESNRVMYGLMIKVTNTPDLQTLSPTPEVRKLTCGVVNLPDNAVVPGIADIESYPWFGLLIYPIGSPSRTTTTVILITTQVAVAAALDIDYYPKHNFRLRSRVILGNKCTGPYIRVRDYSFYPDFTRSTYNSLALVQLETKKIGINVFPICPPPEEFHITDDIYALTLTNDCYNSSMVMVHKMENFDLTRCRDFYRRLELDIASMWPTHLVCAHGQDGDHCIWRSGSALVIQIDGQWKLLGVGTYGPGCGSPARFLDYGMYRKWVKRSLSRIGRPTVTRIADDYLILRRRYNSIPRYGPCDAEETKIELYTDRTTFVPPYDLLGGVEQVGIVIYNVTLFNNVNYRCVTLHVWNQFNVSIKPAISLRRWCVESDDKCGEDARAIYYFVEIRFRYLCTFKVSAFGTSYNNIEVKKIMETSRNDWRLNTEPRYRVEGGLVSVLDTDDF